MTSSTLRRSGREEDSLQVVMVIVVVVASTLVPFAYVVMTTKAFVLKFLVVSPLCAMFPTFLSAFARSHHPLVIASLANSY